MMRAQSTASAEDINGAGPVITSACHVRFQNGVSRNLPQQRVIQLKFNKRTRSTNQATSRSTCRRIRAGVNRNSTNLVTILRICDDCFVEGSAWFWDTPLLSCAVGARLRIVFVSV